MGSMPDAPAMFGRFIVWEKTEGPWGPILDFVRTLHCGLEFTHKQRVAPSWQPGRAREAHVLETRSLQRFAATHSDDGPAQ